MPKVKCLWNAHMVVLDFPAITAPPALDKLQCLSVQRSAIEGMRQPDLLAQPLATPQKRLLLVLVAENGYRCVFAQKRVSETVCVNSDSCYIIQLTRMSVSCWESSVNTPPYIL